jgi:hypothetical protein
VLSPLSYEAGVRRPKPAGYYCGLVEMAGIEPASSVRLVVHV